ncbi:MAG: putative metal-binding motif-containing protein, partial [Myxococcales bacterium]|nr:putative metal-binding motif-containing protein [Myxococcales bacterium]
MRVIWACVALAIACGDDDAPAGDDGGTEDASARCSVDLDCDDGTYCNGAERCAPGNADADARGCIAGTRPCADAEGCDEGMRACLECPDADGDGYADAACGGTDCDDTDSAVNPGAVEICDAEGRDEDCDPSTLGHDLDGDGQVADHCCNRRADGVLLCGTDCNDAVRSVYLGATEVCNGYDDDCDGRIDEGVLLDGFVDADRDGHGDPDRPTRACPGVAGFSTIGDDCDDDDRDIHPGRGEACNGIDDDCDGAIDENVVALTWYRDRDGDGFGDPRGPTQTNCAQPTGYVLLPFDCDDDDPQIHPAAEERCNAIDDDCDGFPGFMVAPGDYEDDDRDGYPDAACAEDPAVADCDDRDYRVNPGAREIVGDGVDNDCDGSVDDRCVMAAWYRDEDGDGYGAGAPTLSCEPVAGHVMRDGDCDDEDPEVRPSATEICNGIDDDCDGRIDELTAPRCVFPNALGVCAEGMCELGVCAAGFLDCGAGAGCESAASSVGTCGACDVMCDAIDAPRASAACLPRAGTPAYECGVSCDVGWGDCDGASANGCETEIFTSVDQCGGCGIAFRCDIPDNASATCAGGRCGIRCDFGYESCDGDEGTGCETRVGSDPANCGMCGRACAPDAPICSDGRCVANPFPPTGATEHFAPTEDVVLTPGMHRFLSIHIPAGVRVTTHGTGILDLRAEGDVIIEGSVDLTGGAGGNSGNLRIPTAGATGDPLSPGLTVVYPAAGVCHPALGGTGSPGGNSPISEMNAMSTCGYGGTNGGGQPDTGGGGAGGGGFAGGGGGATYNVSTEVLRPGGDGGGV